MRRAFMVRKRARKAEKHYFRPRRDEYEEIQTREETFDNTMPSQSQLYGSSIISSTRNMIERPSDDEDTKAGVESDYDDEDYHPSRKGDIREESVDYDKTLTPNQSKAQPPIENEKKSFDCSICPKKFSTRLKLCHHFEKVHLKIKKISCDVCEAKFFQKIDIKNHLQRHLNNPNLKPHNTSNNQRPFKCDFENCRKYFTSKWNLEIHQKTVHSGKEDQKTSSNLFSNFGFQTNDLSFAGVEKRTNKNTT
jgi:Zinc finger, C2H2 type